MFVLNLTIVDKICFVSARWSSISPPPNKQGHRSPKQGHRSPPRNYGKRSGSRSPAHRLPSPRRSPRRSPPKRSVTRSPLRHANVRRYSPVQSKRTKSRSPNRNYPVGNRPRSRSPLHPSNRRMSPVPRNGPKNWRGHSPPRVSQSNRPNGGHQKKSQSPRADLPPPANNYGARRRTRSPPAKPDIRKRSNSRSPLRKYGRNGPPVKKQDPRCRRGNRDVTKAMLSPVTTDPRIQTIQGITTDAEDRHHHGIVVAPHPGHGRHQNQTNYLRLSKHKPMVVNHPAVAIRPQLTMSPKRKLRLSRRVRR